MVIFNSYISLPEGIWRLPKKETHPFHLLADFPLYTINIRQSARLPGTPLCGGPILVKTIILGETFRIYLQFF